MLPPGAFRTLFQRQLVARAANLVQPHAVRALAKVRLVPRSRHTAVKTDGERQRPAVGRELNNFHAAQAAKCTPRAHKTWLDQVPKTDKQKEKSVVLSSCISQRHLNLRRNNEPDSFSGKQMFFTAGSSQCERVEGMLVILLEADDDKPTHTRLLFLLRSSVVCFCHGLNWPDDV